MSPHIMGDQRPSLVLRRKAGHLRLTPNLLSSPPFHMSVVMELHNNVYLSLIMLCVMVAQSLTPLASRARGCEFKFGQVPMCLFQCIYYTF